MKVLCNIMVMRSRPMCTLSLPGLSLTLPILCCLMSQRTNFINLLHCKSKINLSVHIQETANKHTSRKRLNGAPDMIVMASTKLQTIYRLSADPEVHIKKKRWPHLVLYVIQVQYNEYAGLYGHKKRE